MLKSLDACPLDLHHFSLYPSLASHALHVGVVHSPCGMLHGGGVSLPGLPSPPPATHTLPCCLLCHPSWGTCVLVPRHGEAVETQAKKF